MYNLKYADIIAALDRSVVKFLLFGRFSKMLREDTPLAWSGVRICHVFFGMQSMGEIATITATLVRPKLCYFKYVRVYFS